MSDFAPTFPCYAGHLCASHIGEWIALPDISGRLVEIKHSERHHDVMIIVSQWPVVKTGPRILTLDPMTIINAAR